MSRFGYQVLGFGGGIKPFVDTTGASISAMIQSNSDGSEADPGVGAGTIDATNYKWIRFESSGYLNVTDPGNVTILVVAGGGGGGQQWAGGGGGGG